MNSNEPKVPPAERLWTADDVAAYLNVSRSWVYHQAQSGNLPSVKIAGLLRFIPEQLRAFARGEGTRSGRIVVLPVGLRSL